MKHLDRRQFIKMGTMSTAMPMLSWHTGNFVLSESENPEPRINFSSDGLALSPLEYSKLLTRLAQTAGITSDYYSNGGVVEELEMKFADILGKEKAVFFPSGTMANHAALRLLCQTGHRVIVQQLSHIYNDSGDCAQLLSGLNVMPMGGDRATFTLQQVKRVLKQTASNRVATPIGAIAIESPVRRLMGQVFDYSEMKRISDFARERNIGLHLDGARLFIASAYSAIPLRDYTRLFDTVYVSLYKYFNAAAGAILAGPKSLLDNVFHLRRMLGGGLPQVWPYAAVADHYLKGFMDRYRAAIQKSRILFAELKKHPSFKIKTIENGTNVYQLVLRTGDPELFRRRLLQEGVRLPPFEPLRGGFFMKVNESLNRIPPLDLAQKFLGALA